jgi:hypothetical protein
MREHRTRNPEVAWREVMRLEIPGSRFARPGMTGKKNGRFSLEII